MTMTPSQILDVAGGRNGRHSFVRREALRLLRAELPGALVLQNTREPLGNLPIPKPESFIASRIPKKDATFPLVMVGVSSGKYTATAQPARANFRTVTMVVYVIDKASEIEAQLDALDDIAVIASGIFVGRSGFHCLPDGRKLWNECIMGDISRVAGFPEYDGAQIEFQVGQWGLDLWTPVT